MAEKEVELLKILSNAFNEALKGADLEAEALKMAEALGEDDLSVKLKMLEAQERFISAQMLVKEQAEVEFNDLLNKVTGDFDLLRNQVNNLCASVFDELKTNRQAVIDSKKYARAKGIELIEKLQKEL
ncbi:hypothetical protein GF343_01470 [Candidatus Woesearchaeota archaeon]|nr:hypothetical protein [Candidatus Woesearchaeota archaeon]